MARSNYSSPKKLKLICKLLWLGTTLIFLSDRPFGINTLRTIAFSQAIPDETLGDENSQVTPDRNINGIPAELIEGGARRGENLFHSFSQFNVEAGRGAYFANPAGITNIFSRVTGNDASNIQGTLGVNGAADLFLLNPNGIIFGENASLDLNGSFLATTANEIQFGSSGEFSTTDPDAPALLTVKPSAFFFNQTNSGSIENRSTSPAGLGVNGNPLSGLRVPDGESLLLLGGEINIDGAGLHAQDGRIELIAILQEAAIGFNTDATNFSFGLPTQLPLTNIVIENGAIVNTSGEGRSEVFFSQIDSRSISIRAANLILDESLITSDVIGSGVGGDIAIETNQMLLRGGFISNTTLRGNGGNISIKTNNLELTELARINTSTFSEGNGGNITLKTDNLLLTDGGGILSETFGVGNAGDIQIEAGEIEISGSSSGGRTSGLFASTLSETTDGGNGGELTIVTENLTIKDGAVVSTGSFSSLPSGSNISLGQGNAGNIQIEAGSIQLENGGLLTTQTFSGSGGNISLQVEDILSLQGDSLISAEANGVGNGGNIAIDTGFLIAFSPLGANGNDIIANAVQGQGGNIDIFTQGIFGIESRPNLTQFNDITASSEFGLSGIVEIDTPDIDPSQDSFDIPLEPVETAVTRTCKSDNSDSQSEFTVSGRGGLPYSPQDLLETDTGLEDWRVDESIKTDLDLSEREKTEDAGDRETQTIVEAQGWIIDDNGKVVLVADSSATSSSNIAPTTKNCQLNN